MTRWAIEFFLEGQDTADNHTELVKADCTEEAKARGCVQARKNGFEVPSPVPDEMIMRARRVT